jgi:hypothetical protein
LIYWKDIFVEFLLWRLPGHRNNNEVLSCSRSEGLCIW